MSFVERLLPIERNLFLWLNDGHTQSWDIFMFAYSYKYTWIPLLLVMLFMYTYRIPWKESLLVILAMVLVGILCDQISSGIAKPIFERFRPTHHPDFRDIVQTVWGYRGGQFGFTSSHAANGWGIMIFTSLLLKNRWYTLTAGMWVTLTCYTRIYLGVHFVTDIIGGTIIGLLIGGLVYWLYITVRHKWLKVSEDKLKKGFLPTRRIWIINCSIYIIILSIAIASAGISENLQTLLEQAIR